MLIGFLKAELGELLQSGINVTWGSFGATYARDKNEPGIQDVCAAEL